jgi:hypothetical protein
LHLWNTTCRLEAFPHLAAACTASSSRPPQVRCRRTKLASWKSLNSKLLGPVKMVTPRDIPELPLSLLAVTQRRRRPGIPMTPCKPAFKALHRHLDSMTPQSSSLLRRPLEPPRPQAQTQTCQLLLGYACAALRLVPLLDDMNTTLMSKCTLDLSPIFSAKSPSGTGKISSVTSTLCIPLHRCAIFATVPIAHEASALKASTAKMR